MRLLFFALLTLPATVWGQTNLIPNPGFENTTPQVFNYSGGSRDFPCVDVCPTSSVTRNGKQHDYWSTCANWAPPFHSINSSIWPVASPDVECSNTRTGDYCGGAVAQGPNYTEYLTVGTTTALVPTHRYYFEIWIKQLNSTVINIPSGEYGMGLHASHPKQNGDKHISPPMYLTNSSTITTSTTDYVLFAGEFIPNATYNYISIGQFNGNSSYWLVIDDIMLVDMGEADCPADLLIENRNYTGVGTLREVSSTIRAGFDVGFIGTNNDVRVNSGAGVTYKAEEEIRLEPGFSAVSGADFHAYIDECGSDPRKNGETMDFSDIAAENSSVMIRYNDVDETSSTNVEVIGTTEVTEDEKVASLAQMIAIYPVPFHTFFTLNTSVEIDQVLVRDVSGRIVWTGGRQQLGENTIDLSNSASGIYTLEAHSNGTMFRTKITKQ